MDNRILSNYHLSVGKFEEVVAKYLSEGVEFGVEQKKNSAPSKNAINFECRHYLCPSRLATTLETREKFFIFLFSVEGEALTSIALHEFNKQSGQHRSVMIDHIREEITSAEAVSNRIFRTVRDKKLGEVEVSEHEITLVMGGHQGNLHILKFGSLIEYRELSTSCVKLGAHPVIKLCTLDPENFFGRQLCVGLSAQHCVYLVSLEINEVLTTFQPTIVTCDAALGLSIDEESKYFIQTTKRGYVIYWAITEQIMQLIKKSDRLTEKCIEHSSSDKNEMVAGFRVDEISRNCLPLCYFHSASVSGLIWAELCQDLLALIDINGLFRIVAVSNEKSNDPEFISILEFKLKDADLITDVAFYPERQEVFITRCSELEKNENSSYSKQWGKIQGEGVSLSQTQLHRRQEAINLDRGRVEFFERIIYSEELEVTAVEEIYPSSSIREGYRNVTMSQQRDIILLRGSQSFLIGASTLFASR